MVEGGGEDILSTEEWLSRARGLVPKALDKAREIMGFPGKWKMIITKLEQIPSRLSDLSSHPCFTKNALCREQLQAVYKTLSEAIELAEFCLNKKYEGKLQMQSDLDSLSGKLDLNLRDCGLLIKTGVLGEVTLPNNPAEPEASNHCNLKELLARLQIGHLEAKHKAIDTLVEFMKEDEKNVLSVIGRSNIAALVQLLTASSPRIKEKTVMVICWLAESGNFENWLVSEGALPPLIRLVDSGSVVCKEKAIIALQRLSTSSETARLIVGHNGIRPLIEICQIGDSVSQCSAACTLKNISSSVPEAWESLAKEGAVKVMINLLDCGVLLASKEYAAECLQNLTLNDNLKQLMISEGGIRSLLSYLDSPLPQESAVGALRNLIGLVSVDVLVSLDVLPRLVHVLKYGSIGAQHSAASAISRICSTSNETKRLVGEAESIPLLVRMLEVKDNDVRKVAAQAICSLMSLSYNCREVKKDNNSVPNLVALLDPSPQNMAKKYAVSCLVLLSSSGRCKKLMISYGAIGYLKKLVEMDIPDAKKLMESLERGKLKSMFIRK